MDIAGAAVVAEPLPVPQNFVLVSRRQLLDGGKSLDETLKVGHDRLDGRLLQHDLADPDSIGISCPPPRQVARVTPVPAAKVASKPTQRVSVSLEDVIVHDLVHWRAAGVSRLVPRLAPVDALIYQPAYTGRSPRSKGIT
jgi:hypothetical protein